MSDPDDHPTALLEGFLVLQHDRLKSYGEEFRQAAGFLSALCLLLLTAPSVLWSQAVRPANWSILASLASVMAVVLAYFSVRILRGSARSYYSTAAGVLVLERELGLHAELKNPPRYLVSASRRSSGNEPVDELKKSFDRRLTVSGGLDSRLGATLNLFRLFGLLGLAQALVLCIHGLFKLNLIATAIHLLRH